MKKVLLVICFVMLATFGITFNVEPVYASEAVFNDKVIHYNGEEQSILVDVTLTFDDEAISDHEDKVFEKEILIGANDS